MTPLVLNSYLIVQRNKLWCTLIRTDSLTFFHSQIFLCTMLIRSYTVLIMSYTVLIRSYTVLIRSYTVLIRSYIDVQHWTPTLHTVNIFYVSGAFVEVCPMFIKMIQI